MSVRLFWCKTVDCTIVIKKYFLDSQKQNGCHRNKMGAICTQVKLVWLIL